MALDLSALPDDVRALIAMQAVTIARLQAQLAKLRRMHFGRSWERLASSIAQLELALDRGWWGGRARNQRNTSRPTNE